MKLSPWSLFNDTLIDAHHFSILEDNERVLTIIDKYEIIPRLIQLFRKKKCAFFRSFSKTFCFDPEIIKNDQMKQKGNSFLQSIASGAYITFTSSKLFNNFFLSRIDTPLNMKFPSFAMWSTQMKPVLLPCIQPYQVSSFCELHCRHRGTRSSYGQCVYLAE